MMKNVVVGTAGHIDHGKTALVKALTGIDADRLGEEKLRGITIDIGFAVMKEGDAAVHFVDLPGHEKFIRNMVAGASGIDFFLLVVAADESVMPQTSEHLEIMRFLGIEMGIAVLNKIDAVDNETAGMAEVETEALLKDNGYDNVGILKVSAKTGEGVEALRRAIMKQAAGSPSRSLVSPFRLPIDRVFSIKGFGTVITGTSSSGTLKVGDILAFYPSLLKSKVRTIENFGEKKEEASGGERVALNVPEIQAGQIGRGEIAVKADSMFPANYFYVQLELPGKLLKSGSEFQMHIGTMEVPAKISVPGGIKRDATPAPAQLRLKESCALWPKDRFILRLPSPLRTIGGGIILLPSAKRAKWKSDKALKMAGLLSSFREDERLLALLTDNGERGASKREILQRLGILDENLDEMKERLLSEGKIAVPAKSEWWIGKSELESLTERVVKFLSKKHSGPPMRLSIKKEEVFSHFGKLIESKWIQALLDTMVEKDLIVISKDIIKLKSAEFPLSKSDEEKIAKIISVFDIPMPVPASREELLGIAGEKNDWLLTFLVEQGRMISFSAGSFYYTKEGLKKVVEKLQALKSAGRKNFKVPEFKEMLGITRKSAIPLLEYLDEIKVTRRSGDEREILA